MNTLLNITPSLEAKKARAATEIANVLNSTQFFLIQRHNELMYMLWHSPDLTPQEVCDGLGTQAGALFVLGGQTVNFLLAIDSSCFSALEFPTNNFTVQEDGTVIVSQDPYTP